MWMVEGGLITNWFFGAIERAKKVSSYCPRLFSRECFMSVCLGFSVKSCVLDKVYWSDFILRTNTLAK